MFSEGIKEGTLRSIWLKRFITKYIVTSTYIIFIITYSSSPSKNRKGSLFTIKSKMRVCSKYFIDKEPTYEYPYPIEYIIHRIAYQHLLSVVHHIPDENYYMLHLVVEKNCHQEKTPC